LSPHESKTLSILREVGIRPGSTRVATEKALSAITHSISELLLRDINGDQRRFGINFLSYYTDEMTLQEMMTALRGIDAQSLASIVEAVVYELMEDPAVKLISTRDALAGITNSVEDECRTTFEVAKLLHRYLGHQNDMNGWQSGLLLGDELVYGGLDSPLTPGSTEFDAMRKVQQDMKRIGRQIARQKCSRTHIVMSTALGDAWTTDNAPDEKWMVITSKKTDKSDLLIPSQTPVVHKKGDKWLYYGDVSAQPSSELASHWGMHEYLGRYDKNWSNLKSILHAHLVDVIELSATNRNRSEIQIGACTVPNINWSPHGTPDLGERIIKSMIERGVRIAVVKEHGPWFVSQTLSEGYQEALKIVDDIRNMRA
jgi:ribulose-5-phosphate 4-epimerase/fuculose-1-phosphate aldolase